MVFVKASARSIEELRVALAILSVRLILGDNDSADCIFQYYLGVFIRHLATIGHEIVSQLEYIRASGNEQFTPINEMRTTNRGLGNPTERLPYNGLSLTTLRAELGVTIPNHALSQRMSVDTQQDRWNVAARAWIRHGIAQDQAFASERGFHPIYYEARRGSGVDDPDNMVENTERDILDAVRTSLLKFFSVIHSITGKCLGQGNRWVCLGHHVRWQNADGRK